MDNGSKDLPQPPEQPGPEPGGEVPAARPFEGPVAPAEPEAPTLPSTVESESTTSSAFPEEALGTEEHRFTEEPGEEGTGLPAEGESTEALPIPLTLNELLSHPLVQRLSQEQQEVLQDINDNPDLTDEEKIQRIAVRLQEFREDEEQKGEEQDRSEEEKAGEQKVKGFLEEGEELPQDDTPEAEEKRKAWVSKVKEFLGSDDAKDLYKNMGILAALWFLSLLVSFIKIHTGKIQK